MRPAAVGPFTHAAASRSGTTVLAVRNHRAARLRRAGLTLAVTLVLASCGSTVQVHGSAGSAGSLGDQARDGGTGTTGDGTGTTGDGTGTTGMGGGKQLTPLGSPDASGGGAGSSTSGDTTGPTTGVPRTGQPGTEPAGSAIGVTAKTISIGIITEDGYSAFAANAGADGLNTGNMRAEAQAFVDYLNAHGGMAGRKIVPVFYDVNLGQFIASPASVEQAACQGFTQDNKVYAVASAIAFEDESFYQCLRHARVITSSAGETFDEDFFARLANYFYMPVEVNMTRVMQDNIAALKTAGYFSGWNYATGDRGPNPVKVGLIRLDTPSDLRVRDQGVKPALARQGLKLADEQAVSGDPGQSQAQYQSAVLRFRGEGITHVLFTFANPVYFMETANGQKYYPRYGLHSRNGPAAALQANIPPEQLHGSMGLGWQQYQDVDAAHDPGPASDRTKLCLQLLKQAGQDTSARATALVGLWYCDAIFFLADALAAAPSFDPAGFRAGAESLAHFRAASTFRSSFAAGLLHDGARAYRVFAFQDNCNCFTYTTGTKPAN